LSAQTVAEKMHIQPGMKIGFFNAQANVDKLLGDIPDDVEVSQKLENTELDFILAFMEDRQMLEAYLYSLKNAIADDGALWLAYHNDSASLDTDINRDIIHKYCKQLDLKGGAMVSINNDWTGLRFKKI